MGTLLEAGVCMRVPFSRVTIKQPPKRLEKTEEVDIAGVNYCKLIATCTVVDFNTEAHTYVRVDASGSL